MGSQVFAVPCASYDGAEAALRQAVAAMGGMERFVRPGERILLKANLLRPAPPESAVCTHPAVLEAVARMVAEAGGSALIADSPGGALQKESVLRNLYEKTGAAQAARASGGEVCLDPSARLVELPEGKVLRQAEIISPALDCDGIFDLCKMKTHVFMGMTGAVKNSFGLIPGLTKVGFHGSHPDQAQFAQVLLDLIGFMKPRLSVMDAVLAMEGEGPGASGTPRQVGLLLLSDNPLALDVIAGEIMGLPRAAALGQPAGPGRHRRGDHGPAPKQQPRSAGGGGSGTVPHPLGGGGAHRRPSGGSAHPGLQISRQRTEQPDGVSGSPHRRGGPAVQEPAVPDPQGTAQGVRGVRCMQKCLSRQGHHHDRPQRRRQDPPPLLHPLLLLS